MSASGKDLAKVKQWTIRQQQVFGELILTLGLLRFGIFPEEWMLSLYTLFSSQLTHLQSYSAPVVGTGEGGHLSLPPKTSTALTTHRGKQEVFSFFILTGYQKPPWTSPPSFLPLLQNSIYFGQRWREDNLLCSPSSARTLFDAV